MTQQDMKLPLWFWGVGAGALVWNLLGVGAYIGQVTISDTALAALPSAERAFYESYPAWAAGAFAIAVFGGVLGSALLLARRKLASPVLGASLAGVVVQMFHSFAIANSLAVFGAGAATMPVMILLIAAALLWHARRSTQRGWLR